MSLLAARRRSTAGLTLALALGTTGIGAWAAPASADPGGIVISELNYHAKSDSDNDDWLELTNTGAAAVDVSGWTFTAGVTATLPPGSSIPAGGRFVVAKDTAAFTTLNGFAPDAVYTGNLSNGGETVTLSDATGAVVDTVAYLDGSESPTSPWPTAPDAGGPTLELRFLDSDNTLAENWGASRNDGGTPGKVNSIDGVYPPPVAQELTATPREPTANQEVRVTVRLQSGSTARLTYKVMFDADQTVAMTDEGGGVFSATIPRQAAGRLVRYRVDAVSASGVAYSAPAEGAPVRYEGVVVANPSVTSQLPVVQWFMDDAVYNDILANHRQDDYQGQSVWYLDGRVVDGVLMNIRGNSSRLAAKVNWKVELPSGYTTTLDGRLPYPLDEFALQNYADNNADLAWATVRAAGARALNLLPVRSQRNGAFHELGRIMETMSGEWRDDQGVDDWAIYKGDAESLRTAPSAAQLQANAWLDKKTRKDEDYTDVWQLTQKVDATQSAAQLTYLYDNVNVPELINYMAINSVIRHQDSGYYNWWITRDTEGTGRWELWHWDLNWTFSTPASDGKGLFLTPDTTNRLTRAMLYYPEFREMFFRRLRTLSDQFLPAGTFEAQWDAITAKTTPEWNLDRAIFGGRTPASARTAFLAGLADRRNAIANNTGPGLPVPTSQAATASAVISEIQYQPSGAGGEFVELANPGTTAVDVSGWRIPEVGLTIQPGTVIPAGGQVVFVQDDVAFRTRFGSGNRLVGGQFTGSLSDGGQTLTLVNGQRTVDTVTYGSTAPWPTAAAGTGPSLELTSLTADNSQPTSWAATSTTGGTPGKANTAVTPPQPTTEVVLPLGSTWRYNDSRANLGTTWRSTTYNDTTWKSGLGQFGFGDGDEKTLLDRGPTNSRLVTAYFRTTFQVTSRTALTRATLDLMRDDGAVVYVNGTQVTRSNMPTGTISYGTLASSDVTGTNESRLYSSTIPLTALRDGTNTIAVEVHQRSASSSDLSFDARVTLTR